MRVLPTRRFLLSLALTLAFALGSIATAVSDEKKDDKPEPPFVTVISPFGLIAGSTNLIRIRGRQLTNEPSLRFLSVTGALPLATIRSAGKADVPKDADAKRVGDTQLEIEIVLAAGAQEGPLPFQIISGNGESQTNFFIVLNPTRTILEREPNGGFRQAQPIELNQTVQGLIGEPADVDVFSIQLPADRSIVVEVSAHRWGSLLDSVVTLYDSSGHILATNDDHDGQPDSRLVAKLPTAGLYFLGIIDAHDKGGATHPYHLRVTAEPQ